MCVQGLNELGYEIVSTGGSAAAIDQAGIPVQRVEELTGFPEMLDGEVPQGFTGIACITLTGICRGVSFMSMCEVGGADAAVACVLASVPS